MDWPQPLPAPRKGEPEKAIEDYVCRKALEWWSVASIKLNLKGRRSWPDRQFFIPGGRPLFIEFKKPGEVPTGLQNDTHEFLRKNGYAAEVCDNREAGLAAVARCLAESEVGRTLLEQGARRRKR